MTPTPKPPTRLVVSGGRKAEPRLYMAHPSRTLRISQWLGKWGVALLAVITAVLLILGIGVER